MKIALHFFSRKFFQCSTVTVLNAYCRVPNRRSIPYNMRGTVNEDLIYLIIKYFYINITCRF